MTCILFKVELTQSQKLAHKGRITQVHIRRPSVHSPTNVELLPTLIPPFTPRPDWSVDAQTWMDLTLIPCKDMTSETNSIPKAISREEDCPSPYKGRLGNGLMVSLYGLGQSFPRELAVRVELGSSVISLHIIRARSMLQSGLGVKGVLE